MLLRQYLSINCVACRRVICLDDHGFCFNMVFIMVVLTIPISTNEMFDWFRECMPINNCCDTPFGVLLTANNLNLTYPKRIFIVMVVLLFMKAVHQRHVQYVILPCWLKILVNVARQHVDV